MSQARDPAETAGPNLDLVLLDDDGQPHLVLSGPPPAGAGGSPPGTAATGSDDD